MCVVRWVISGAIISTVFFSIFIDMWSWPTEFLLLDLSIMFFMSDTVGRGMVKVFLFLGYMFLSIYIGETGTLGILSLSFCMESM